MYINVYMYIYTLFNVEFESDVEIFRSHNQIQNPPPKKPKYTRGSPTRASSTPLALPDETSTQI